MRRVGIRGVLNSHVCDLRCCLSDPAGLVSAALAEIGRGAGWVKVIADFPDLAAGTDADADATYRIEAVARLVADHQLS